MAKKKTGEEWLTLPEAVELLTTKHGRRIAPGFVTRLAKDKKVQVMKPDKRTNLYLKSSLEAYPLRPKRQITAPAGEV